MTHRIERKFYPLTSHVAKSLKSAKLTAAEWRLWSYLVEINRYNWQHAARHFGLEVAV